MSCKCQTSYSESGVTASVGCAAFNQLTNIPEKTIDILHKLLVIFQGSAVSLVESFNNYFKY